MAKNSKQKPIFGLSKLPTKAYIKSLEDRISELNIEKGKDKSYIEELEYNLKLINSRIENSSLEGVAREDAYNKLSKKLGDTIKKNIKLQKTNKELIDKIIKLSNNGQKETL